MNILFYQYGSICEPDLTEQFTNIGFHVDSITNEITNKHITNNERISLLTDKISSNAYLFVFSINFFPVISEVCKIFGIKYVSWSVDSPLDELFSTSANNETNRIFCFDKTQYDCLASADVRNISYLPLGTNVSRWDNVISQISAFDINKYSHDISFVGSLYTDKDQIATLNNPSNELISYIESSRYKCGLSKPLSEIGRNLSDKVLTELKNKLSYKFYPNEMTIVNMDSYCALNDILSFHLASMDRITILNRLSEIFNVDLYTRSGTDKLCSSPHLIIHEGISTLLEMPKVFHLSKINLNITMPSIETGLSLRCWDILGCGGFLISNYQKEFDDFLTSGIDYENYCSIDELIDKCAYYLSHDDNRRRIALSGYEKVKKYHTYANRMPAIIKSLME